MIDRYVYHDLIFRDNTLSQNLRIENGSSILKIFRLISGTLNCEDQYKSKTYKLRTNFLNFPFDKNSRLSSKTILSNFPEEVEIKDLDEYFRKARNNIKFYDSIEIELLKCLIAHHEERYLESFFYLYRIIEGISYSIPLMYVSKSKDYNKTYGDLQSFFGKDKDGELAFFKRFIAETFKDKNFYKSSILINMRDIDIEEIIPIYYKIYIDKMNNRQIVEPIEDESIKIKFIGFYEFIIELRNRFFHNAKGSWQSNLESTNLLFPDLFFKPLIGHGINWISLILFEIIKTDFDKNLNS